MKVNTLLRQDTRIINETHIPYIGKTRVMYYCFGDYEKWHTRMLACKYCKVKTYCINKDTSKIEWSPIIARVSKTLEFGKPVTRSS